MEFRKAKLDDILKIKNLYDSVKGSEFCTWHEDYPGDFEINEDFNSDNLFVLEDNNDIIGAISIIPENELDDIKDFKVHDDAAEFARVVIRKDYQGKGLSKLLVENIIEEIRNRNKKTIHILVAKVNIPAQKLYKSCGFDFIRDIYKFQTDFILCELVL
ncbi:MAG: GNAT family N-acetyltransferase [Clostridia bacterium]|nr:GNAT family N-acetyltransferase [Clostridia bacterium]